MPGRFPRGYLIIDTSANHWKNDMRKKPPPDERWPSKNGPSLKSGEKRSRCIPFLRKTGRQGSTWRDLPEMYALFNAYWQNSSLVYEYRGKTLDLEYMKRKSRHDGELFVEMDLEPCRMWMNTKAAAALTLQRPQLISPSVRKGLSLLDTFFDGCYASRKAL